MAKQDYGIIISQPGVSVGNATGSQITFNTANAMIKLDTQNKAAFQTVTIIITTDPPNPPSSGAGGTTYTTLYKFKHGYSYIPSVEMLCNVTTPPPGVTGTQTYFQDIGSLGNITPGDDNIFYSITDATWVYLIVKKFNGGFGTNALLTGTNLVVTTHVFVEDIGAP